MTEPRSAVTGLAWPALPDSVGASLLADPARTHAALLQIAAARKEKLAKKAAG